MSNNWPIGLQLSNFIVEEFLGRGGMAQVYRGRDVILERPVAIKIIAAPFREDPEYTARFLREGRAMARWRHENIVQIYYAGQEDELHYMVMEFGDGVDLKTWLHRYHHVGVLAPYDEVLRIGWGVAKALDYAHSFGVIHRDVKPANILLSDDGRVLLTDFGLVLDLQEGSMGEAFGSPRYIAPEQARSSTDVVPQTDLYALGVILYEMLSGATPFEADSPTAMAVQHMTEQPPSPRLRNPRLNQEVEAVLLKSLSKLPADRYQSGQELMAALTAALEAGDSEEWQDNVSLGSRSISSVPVAEKVAAYLSGPPPGPAAVAGNDSIDHPIVSKRLKNIWPVAGVIAGLLLACILGLFVVAFLIGQTNQGNGEITDNGGGVLSGTAGQGEGTPPTTVDSTGEDQGLGEEVAATVTLPGGGGANNSLVLFYNPAGFYAWNPGSQDIDIRQLIFEAIDNNGQPAGFQFDGRRWAAFYPEIESGKCDRLEIIGASPIERPQQCQNYNALLTPESFDTMIFWLARDNISQFRVLYEGQEAGRCEITAGQCEVSLP